MKSFVFYVTGLGNHLGHVYLAFLILFLALSILLITQHKTGQLLTNPDDLEVLLKVLFL